jgi:sodium transport system permease protein
MWIAAGVQQLYPINERMLAQLQDVQHIIMSAPSVWHILALMALAPAICEELAFRGFILSGLRHMGHKWGAIVISSLLFGVTHGILQQSISATLVGIVIGYVAVQTGSLLPGIVFHLVYNTLGVSATLGGSAWWASLLQVDGATTGYRWLVIVAGTLLSIAILAWFHRLPHAATPEEELREALSQQSARATVP